MSADNILQVRVMGKQKMDRYNVKLAVEIEDKHGGIYLTFIQKDIRTEGMSCVKFGRIYKPGFVRYPHVQRKKCQLCDKFHYKGYCRFDDQTKKEGVLTEVFHSIRLKAVLDGTFTSTTNKNKSKRRK